MGMFDGLGDTELFDKGVYLTAGGSYELEVVKILVKDTRKSGLGFIVEFKVVSVDGDAAEGQHAPGSKATWFQKLQDKDISFPAIKEFFLALLDVDRNNPTEYEEFNNSIEELLEEATSWEPDPEDPESEHPLAGQRVDVDTYSKLTKKNVEFTVHNWSASTSEEAA